MYRLEGTVNDSIILIQKDQWISAKGYLGMAKLLRAKEYGEALYISESMISLSVKGFTDDRKIDDLSKHELSTLAKIKNYRDEKCIGSCLGDIKEIIEHEKVRITRQSTAATPLQTR